MEFSWRTQWFYSLAGLVKWDFKQHRAFNPKQLNLVKAETSMIFGECTSQEHQGILNHCWLLLPEASRNEARTGEKEKAIPGFSLSEVTLNSHIIFLPMIMYSSLLSNWQATYFSGTLRNIGSQLGEKLDSWPCLTPSTTFSLAIFQNLLWKRGDLSLRALGCKWASLDSFQYSFSWKLSLATHKETIITCKLKSKSVWDKQI